MIIIVNGSDGEPKRVNLNWFSTGPYELKQCFPLRKKIVVDAFGRTAYQHGDAALVERWNNYHTLYCLLK